MLFLVRLRSILLQGKMGFVVKLGQRKPMFRKLLKLSHKKLVAEGCETI
jgi:hypothetical protein